MKGEGSNWVCVGVERGERVFLGERVWRCGGKSKKKKERDEKMREKVDEISNERGESVCGECVWRWKEMEGERG